MDRVYNYATVKRWVDGDTVDAEIDFGFKVTSVQRFRLARINTPEHNEPGYAEAAARSNELAPVGTAIDLTCHGYDRYGRWIASVKNQKTGVEVNQVLLDEKLAKPYKG